MLAACATTEVSAPMTQAETESPATSLLTILASKDPQTQLMALVLTRAAMAGGETPQVLLCGDGGDLALREPPAAALAPQQPRGASPAGMLRELVSQGVQVEVCAIYLPNRPFGAEALIDGVGVAMPPAIASVFSRRDVRVLSF